VRPGASLAGSPSAGPVTRENLASAVRTLEGFVFKSVITSKKPTGSVDTGRMTESAQVHGMLHVPAALLPDAGVVKLADARDSKSRGVHSSGTIKPGDCERYRRDRKV
jgi:hypothetical protein